MFKISTNLHYSQTIADRSIISIASLRYLQIYTILKRNCAGRERKNSLRYLQIYTILKHLKSFIMHTARLRYLQIYTILKPWRTPTQKATCLRYLQIYTILKHLYDGEELIGSLRYLQIYTILKRDFVTVDHSIGLRYLQIYTILKPQMSGNKCPIRIINLQIPILLYNPAQIPVYQNHVFFCFVRPVFNTQNAAPQIPCFSCQSMYLFTAKIILHSNENKKS